MNYHLDAYDYFLPREQIALYPLSERADSRLMVLHRPRGTVEHRLFRQLPEYLQEGDCLVLNNTKVFPARLVGRKATGGKVEIFLLHFPRVTAPQKAAATGLWKSSKPIRPGQIITCSPSLEMEIKGVKGEKTEVILHYEGHLSEILEEYGQMPLPPYIKRPQTKEDFYRYQTVYARKKGSVAAPTAGLHFTEEIFAALREKGVKTVWITLHVGYGTFKPVRVRDITRHKIDPEWVSVSSAAAQTINTTKAEGGRVIGVGTTTVRTLEWTAIHHGKAASVEGYCGLYIYPGHTFKVVDAMITNFHLPKSSLLILVAAFAGRKNILSAYDEAVKKGYRFYSYGDAMLIL